MEGRIRLVTATTPTYACVPVYLPGGARFVVHHQKFRLPAAQARYLNLPNTRTTTRENGNDFQGWAIYTDRRTRSL